MKGTVLIVEDEADLRGALTTAFEAADFTVLTADDGEKGYKKALATHPDVILLDIAMPNMDGHEALKRIRNDTWGKNAKVVFLTAYSDARNVSDAIEQGSEEFIVKSNTSLEEIITKVREVMHT